ncbi:MAG TPA: hypothetical protein VKN18_30545 [Blastocatellia bacterium]|nr:hypothetical protein [Blastocatellia bacterium]
MYRSIKNTVILGGVFVIFVLGMYSPSWTDRLIFWGVGGIGFIILAVLIGERVRRVIEGYYTYMSGGAEDGDLVYKQAGNTLRLYFKRRQHIIYVPSDMKWIEVMPDWAKANKNLIMTRIRSQVGRHWMFEDTEKREHILGQK